MRINNYQIANGVDIEDIGRFNIDNPEKYNNFINRIFTQQELEYCLAKKNPHSHLAVRFSAKEAVIKALTSLGFESIDYKSIEIMNNEAKVPFVKLLNPKYSSLKFIMSLSHSKQNAIAFVIALKVAS